MFEIDLFIRKFCRVVAAIWPFLVASAFAWCSPHASAQAYPTRPVELVVPFAAGGGSDVMMRAWADAATRVKFPQPVIVINRPGAAGAIGTTEGANAKPDGHKITMVSVEINLVLLQGIGKTRPEEFTYIARVNADPLLLAVRTDSPLKTLEDFISAAKARPGEITVANSGNGAMFHLGAAALEEKSGIKFNNIPYIGAGPEIIALMAGQVDSAILTTAEIGTWVRDGKARILAVMASKRLKDFNQVPTFKEKGIDLDFYTWRSLAVPKATPPYAVNALKDLARKINDDKGYQELLERQFVGSTYEDGESMPNVLANEYKFYGGILERLGLRK